MAPFRAGMIAVVGRPNVGKSTLINTLVGHKVSIVSDKAQTTRRRVLGIATHPDWQAVFVDTPGVHKPHHRLGKALNEAARQALTGVDAVLVVVDASKAPNAEDESLATMLRNSGVLGEEARSPVLLCMNKMDLLKPMDVQDHFDWYIALFPTELSMMTSMTRHKNVDRLVELIVGALPEGPPLYPEDDYTDQTMRAMAAEIVREKALRVTRQEVPHALATYTEVWEEEPARNLVKIAITLLVEREGQKAILIGKKGEMLKRIGTEARLEIEELTGGKVFLELFVKVRSEWRDSERMLKELEYM